MIAVSTLFITGAIIPVDGGWSGNGAGGLKLGGQA